jgi:tetratricopeptide (TPR) repeat protein
VDRAAKESFAVSRRTQKDARAPARLPAYDDTPIGANVRPFSAGGLGTLAAAAVLVACGLAVYGNALRHPFLIDDKLIILGDPRVQTADVRALLTQQYWPGQRGNRLYRPLVSLSFALNWAISHEPWTFRLPNLLLHVGAGLAVFLMLRELTRAYWPALAAAVLFVVHPIHTTALNQIVDRADIAVAACILFATWLYARDTADRPKRAWIRPVLGAALFALALLCKENAVVLIGLVALLDVCGSKLWGRPVRGGSESVFRSVLRRALRCYLPLAAVLLAYVAVRTSVLGGVARKAADIPALDNIMAYPEYGLQPGESRWLARWGTPLAVFGQAAGLLVWPWPLSWDYSYAAVDSVRTWRDVRPWFGAATLAGSLVLLVSSWRRQRIACFAAGLALISYSVVSNTVIVIGSAFAERYLYLPSAGYCMLAAWLIAALGQWLARTARPAGRCLSAAIWIAVVAAGAGYAALTVVRNRDFQSEAVLNAADLRAQPRSSRLWSAAAADALNAGQAALALQHAERALAIYADEPNAWRVAAIAHWRRRDADQALACLQKSFDHGGADSENAWVTLADILKSRGEYARAIAALEAFVAMNARAAVARNNLAWYLLTAEPPELRDPQRALPYAKEAVKLQPAAGDFLDTYLSVLLALGRRDEARRVLEERVPQIPAADPQRPGLLEKLGKP